MVYEYLIQMLMYVEHVACSLQRLSDKQESLGDMKLQRLFGVKMVKQPKEKGLLLVFTQRST